MTSSTSLYTDPNGNANVASKNFTTLYSGSGVIYPTQPYGNANVVDLLSTSTDGANTIGIISATGNIITNAYFIGDGSLISNISGANVTGNVVNAQYVTNPAQANITSVGVLTGLSSTGNITAPYFLGNASNAIYAVTAGTATLATNATHVTANAQANITSVGVLTGLSSTGNITAPYFLGNVYGNIIGNVVVPGANTQVLINANGNLGTGDGFTFDTVSNVLSVPGSVTAVGNVQGAYILGNGSQLTGLPATYGNADVSAYLASGTNSADIVTTANVIGATLKTSGATGNIVGANYVSANYYLGDGGLLSNVAGSYSNANVVSLLASFGSNNISTTGNVSTGKLTVSSSGNTWTINGSTLTSPDGGIWLSDTATHDEYIQSAPGGYINMAALHGNGQFATQLHLEQTVVQVTADANTWSFEAGNLTLPGNTFAVNYANGTPVSLAGTYANANVADFLANFGSNSISTTGNITSGNLLTSGIVSATGNVTGAYLFGNASTVSGIVPGAETVQIPVKNTSGGTLVKGTPVYATGTVGATDVLEVSASRADTAATMPCVGLLETTLGVNATGYAISIGHLAGYDTSTYAVGQTLYVAATGGLTNTRPNNGYLVQPVGTVGRVNASNGSIEVNSWNYFQLPNLGSGNIWVGNASSIPVETTLASYTGNIGAGNISASGNVTAAYFIGNVVGNIVGNVDAAGSNTQVQFNDTGDILGASAGFTFDKTANLLTVSGNVQGGNVLTGGLVSAVGNVSGGNLIINSDNTNTGHIQSAKSWDTSVVSGTVPNPGRITIGTGYAGNFSPNFDLFTQGRNAYVYEMNKSNIATAGLRTQNFTSTLFANVNANINSSTNGATRFATNINALVIGGGTSGGNLVQTNPQGMAASIHNLAVGGTGTYADIGTYNAGNQWFNGLLAAVNCNSGSNIGIGCGAQTTNNITVNGAANTLIGFAAISSISNAGKLNIGVYIPTEAGSTLPTDMPTGTGQYQATSNQVTGNTASGFTADYYGIRIDSNLAKQKLGSINTFHQTNLATSASGNITINKNNGQFQTLNITADTNIVGFANVVTQANTTVQTTVSYQSDTITLVIRQSTTGNTVTMPTGTAYKYTGGSSTITSTANAVQIVTAIAVYNTTTAANEYLIDISPVYS